MRGPPPLPTSLKELRGNPGKRPLNRNEPRPATVIPQCPSTLKGEARKEWRRITRELAAVRVVTKLDRAALAAYCMAWARWVEAEEKIARSGSIVKAPSGYPMLSPYLVVANKAIEQMTKLAGEFGLTPSSRSRIHAPGSAATSDAFDEFLDNTTPLKITGSA